MDAPARPGSLRVVLRIGIAYALIGVAFGELAGRSASDEARVAWRVAAWVVSGVAFAAHIGYEPFRVQSSLVTTALRAASASGIGSFGLALAAVVHARATAGSFPLVMLVLWLLLTASPAFVVALVAAAVLDRVLRSRRR